MIGANIPPPPPPELCEETLMSPEHNEILTKLRFILILVREIVFLLLYFFSSFKSILSFQVDTIIEVARNKAAPLAAISESPSRFVSSSGGAVDINCPNHRRLHQVLLYMRCLHLLSQTLEFSRAELKSKKLKPSTSVKNGRNRVNTP